MVGINFKLFFLFTLVLTLLLIWVTESKAENVPGSLSEFEPIDIKPSQITFSWQLPDKQANGVITGYSIQWGSKPEPGKSFIPENSRHFDAGETQGTITSLMPGEEYTFRIRAKTKVGNGDWFRREQKMPILPPPPAKSVFPTEISRTMHTITIRFRKNYFSDENGKVLGYTIIVAEDYTKPTENDPFLPSWRDVQQFSSWPPFQVIDPYNPFNWTGLDEYTDFTVGKDDCTDRWGKCNGPLKPGSIYRFKIRAYTGIDKFSETKWSQGISTDPTTQPSSSELLHLFSNTKMVTLAIIYMILNLG